MIKRYVNAPVERIWDVLGHPNYFFGDDNELYRITTKGELRQISRCMKRYTQGYVLKSRFYSLAQLRSMLRRHEFTGRPAGF